ncbi:MAG: Nif3-like dinuclear metal center hexameric protein [Candidatus Izemoplasma sp.]|nr:Nif3-like dinuclear metal center hexameric protein [Candidatus Izemoplasma sp.]
MERTTLKTILDQLFKPEIAYEWDNVGLQVGGLNNITNILVTLDVTLDVVNEAITNNCNLIVAHHPLLFKPQKKVLNNTPLGAIVHALIKNDIALYIAHTNFDLLPNGMNTTLANLLHLNNQTVLDPIEETHGIGVIGTIDKALPVLDVIEEVKDAFNLPSVMYVGDTDKAIKTVAIVGGSGSSFIDLAHQKSADLFITGDVTYHHALEAKALGLALLNVNHNIEQYGVVQMERMLIDALPEHTIILSQIDTNPYKNL